MARTRVTDGRAILSKRELLGISQRDLAARIGVTASYLSRIESGVETPGLTSDTVRKLADVLGMDLYAITVPVEMTA